MGMSFINPVPTRIRRGLILGQKRGLLDGARKKNAMFFRHFRTFKEHTYQNLKEIMYMIYISQYTFLISNGDRELYLCSRYSAKTYTLLCVWPWSLEDQITTFPVTSGTAGLDEISDCHDVTIICNMA